MLVSSIGYLDAVKVSRIESSNVSKSQSNKSMSGEGFGNVNSKSMLTLNKSSFASEFIKSIQAVFTKHKSNNESKYLSLIA